MEAIPEIEVAIPEIEVQLPEVEAEACAAADEGYPEGFDAESIIF